jgi:UDP-N-acetylmuramate--alanine ligase
MPDLVPHERVHVIGAGGAGMSGLAKILAQGGHTVTGSDLKPGPALLALQAVGVETWVGHRPERAGEWDLVVASSAVPAWDPEVRGAVSAGVDVWQRPRLLEEITGRVDTIGVTGTHGKTTTTAMMVTALRSLGRDPSFMVGGELISLNTNAHLGLEALLVLEADEAFGTFLGLDLEGLVLTNVEPDHLDHYETLPALEAAFVEVARRVDGPVVACVDDPGARVVAAAVPAVVGYGRSDDAEWRITNVAHSRSEVVFTLGGRGVSVRAMVPKPGDHIVRNAAGTLALLGELGLDVVAAAEGLRDFGGVRRRFEVRAPREDVLVVDDYAHHPTEIRATIAAAAIGHHGDVVAVFQPHRYSRTAEHGIELGRALAAASRVFVTDVYPAGEAPIPGVTGRLVADAVESAGSPVEYVPRRQDLAAAIAAGVKPHDVILLLGAGDIALVADELSLALAEHR